MRKIIPVVFSGATALAVAAATAGFAVSDKAVTLSLDGQARELSTMAGTVGDLLENEGIEISPRDVVAPTPETKLTDGTQIAVRFVRRVTFTIDGQPQTIWTTATTVDQAMDALIVDTAGADLSTSRSAPIGRDGLDIAIATAKTVTIKVPGKDKRVTVTGLTVADALKAAKITVDRNDKLSAAPSSALKDGTTLRYIRVDVKTKKKKQSVAYGTVRKDSKTLERGKTKVDVAGVKGVRTRTYRIVRHDGKIVSVKRIDSDLTKKPKDRVLLVGTKKPPEPKESEDRESSGGGNVSGGVWDRLAQCESGGNWSINTGNGYYGGVQFSLGTWRAYGGRGYPHQNSKAQQIAIAKKLQAAAGWGQWPSCSRKLGLR